jgi:hypothetical protein
MRHAVFYFAVALSTTLAVSGIRVPRMSFAGLRPAATTGSLRNSYTGLPDEALA